MAFLLVGFASGTNEARILAQRENAIGLCFENAQDPISCQIYISEDAQKTTYGYSCTAYVLAPSVGWVKGKLYLDDASLGMFGRRFQALCSFSPLKSAYRSQMLPQGQIGSFRMKELQEDKGFISPFASLRSEFIEGLERLDAGEESRGLLEALACGYRPTLRGTSLSEEFQIAGLAHIVAVSGAHLGIVVGLLGRLLVVLRVKPKQRILLQLVGMACFLVVSAFPVSAFRAAFMVAIALCAFFSRRRSSSQNALGLCIMLFVATDPPVSLSVSFALSALSTAGIVVFARVFADWLKEALGTKARLFAESLALTLSSGLMTLPLGAALFSQLSIISLLSNVVVGSLFAPVCCMCVVSVFATFLALPGASLLVQFSLLLCGGMGSIVSALSALPLAAIACDISVIHALALSGLCCALLLLGLSGERAFSMRVKGKAITLVAAVCLLPAGIWLVGAGADVMGPVQLVALDVGQGDALLVRDGFGSALVDTGNQPTKLKQQLARRHVMSLRQVFITHADDDHCGALEDLVRVVAVGEVCVAAPLLQCPCEKCAHLRETLEKLDLPVRGVAPGDSVAGERCRIDVLLPYAFSDEGGNSDSLCLRLSVERGSEASAWTALLTGDTESGVLEQAVRANILEDVDVFKVGHHGSKVSCSDAVLGTIRPEIALISVGAGNRYGHPTEEALALLGQYGVSVFRTDEGGAIICRFKNDRISVQQDG